MKKNVFLVLVLLFSLKMQVASASMWELEYDTTRDYVMSMAEYQNALYVGSGDQGELFKYENGEWSLVHDFSESYVNDLEVFEGKLFVATGVSGRVYVFDGSNWALSFDPGETHVMSLAVYENKLYAGTAINGQIYVYDGSSWTLAYDTDQYYIMCMTEYNGKLFVGTKRQGKIYVFDGTSWSLAYDPGEYAVYAMVVFDNKLYVSTGSNGRVYTYNGSSWKSYSIADSADITSLAVYNQVLYAGGSYYAKVYMLENENWATVYFLFPDEIDVMYSYKTRLYVGCNYPGVVFSFTEFDFGISVSDNEIFLQRNESKTVAVSVELLSGIPENVTVSGSWVGETPAGLSASLSVNGGEPPFSFSVSFFASSTVVSGTHTYQVTAAWENITKSVDITVHITAPPMAPTLFSPLDGTVLDDLTPALEWEQAPEAESYTVQLAYDNEFTNIALERTTTDTQIETPQLHYGTTYYWRVRAANQYGMGDWSEVWSFRLSATPPKVVSVQVENGVTFVNSTTVGLSISAQNAVEMSFSTDGIIWSDWEPYENVKSYSLPAGDGEKTIYVRVRDNEGNLSMIKAVSVTLDQTPPTTTYSLQGTPSVKGYLNSVFIQFKSTDATSGVATIYYRVDGEEWKSGTSVLISEPGTHTVEYYSVDKAGNAEEVSQIEVKVCSPAAGLPGYFWAGLAVVIAAGGVGAYLWYRGKPARRLREIETERAELERMKRKADRDYFDLGRISRETYDSMVRQYKERLAELEREERLLKKKLKQK